MGLADELGLDDTTPIQRYQQQLREPDALPAAQAAEAKRNLLLPAAHVGDSQHIRKAHIGYLKAIGDPQWRQRLDDLTRYDSPPIHGRLRHRLMGPWREPITPLAQYLNAVKLQRERTEIDSQPAPQPRRSATGTLRWGTDLQRLPPIPRTGRTRSRTVRLNQHA
ncbi:hypothetical protein [Nocardia africana]|uniref:hypothetical protein n=1 Tax=Nocardia africana TaxID=134964 RepID=UPI000AE5876F|nr:hypothetical protein [Nocardia africana]MCC3311409.1 hypothetical protein [Nocardia africana]